MSRFHFIRHGESISNARRIFNNSLENDPLTEKGIQQAMATAKWFEKKPMDALYSSPIPRALETAGFISAKIKKPINVLTDLMEFRIGDLQNRPMNEENSFVHETTLKEWKNGVLSFAFPGGETYTQLIQRFKNAIRKMMSENPSGNIVVVGHGGQIIFGLQAICANANWEPVWGTIMSNCAISIAEIELTNQEITGKLIQWTNVEHLPEELINTKKIF